MDFRVKGSHYTARNSHILTLCQIVELYKTFEKYVLKMVFFIHKTFSKSNFKLEKSNFQK